MGLMEGSIFGSFGLTQLQEGTCLSGTLAAPSTPLMYPLCKPLPLETPPLTLNPKTLNPYLGGSWFDQADLGLLNTLALVELGIEPWLTESNSGVQGIKGFCLGFKGLGLAD